MKVDQIKVLTLLKIPFAKIFNTNSFYEKTFATASIICILFAVVAAKTTISLDKLKFTALLSYEVLFILFIAFCCICYRFVFTKLVQPLVQEHYFNNEIYPSKEERKEKSHRITKWMLDIIQYSILISFSYSILKNTNFLPNVMFGTGHVRNCFIGKLDEKLFESTFKPYYLVQIGIHIYSLFYQVLGFGNNIKYYEFCLHHFLAFFLIFFSYQLNEIRVGALVLLIHEVSDITYPLARLYIDYKNKYQIPEAIFFLIMIFSWTITRMIIYPFWIAKEAFIVTYQSITHQSNPYFEESNNLFTAFFSFLLLILIFIHYYWGIFMYFAAYTTLVQRKAKFSYEKLNLIAEKKTN